MERLIKIMTTLRGPDGCPWDKEQDHKSLKPYIIEEAYEVHKRIIEWHAQFSKDKIPDQAVGLDPVALKLMRWAMESWERVQKLNQYFAGTWMPRIQLDLLPALRCAAHFVIISKSDLETKDDYISGGRAMYRFWLTSTRLGLQLQPEMTPLIFSRYIEQSRNFTQNRSAQEQAEQLAMDFENLIGVDPKVHSIFMGRVGNGMTALSRSIRLNVNDLIKR